MLKRITKSAKLAGVCYDIRGPVLERARLLEEEGVATIGGPDFGILGEGYMRLSYANSAENIRRAIARMADFFARNHNAKGH